MTQEVLAPSAVIVGAHATTQGEAIERVGGLLVEHGYVSADYVAAMRERESIISTYLGNGIALPHGTSAAHAEVRHTGLAVAQFPAGVPWGEESARLVIGVAASGDEHIAILSRLATILADTEMCERLATSSDAAEIHRLLTTQEEEPSAWSDGDAAPPDARVETVRLENPAGLHARPAAQIVERMRDYTAEVTIQIGGRRANARSITGLLGLGATVGGDVTVSADGEDAAAALAAVLDIVTSRSD